jgi:hypothetical protein
MTTLPSLLLVGILAQAQAQAPPAATDAAVARRAQAPPTIDGKLDDPCWKAAQPIDRFPSFWNGTPTPTGPDGKPRIVAYLTWDDDNLYFAARLSDTELRTNGVKRNDRLWEGDVLEMFFKPDADRPPYYEFQVNPKGLILELAFPERGVPFEKLAALPPLGMTAAVTVDGTPDQPGDTDRGWTAEGKIPWSVFEPTGGRPQPGATWRFALCAFDYGPPGTDPLLSSSAPLTKPNFHRYEDYGRITFEGP